MWTDNRNGIFSKHVCKNQKDEVKMWCAHLINEQSSHQFGSASHCTGFGRAQNCRLWTKRDTTGTTGQLGIGNFAAKNANWIIGRLLFNMGPFEFPFFLCNGGTHPQGPMCKWVASSSIITRFFLLCPPSALLLCRSRLPHNWQSCGPIKSLPGAHLLCVPLIMPSSSSTSSILPLLSFRGLPLRASRFSASSSVRRHTNSSAAFTASSIASSSCASGDSAIMFKRSRRRFFRTDSRSSDGRSRKKCCSSRMVAIALMPLLPITVFLLTLFLLPVKQAKRQEPLSRCAIGFKLPFHPQEQTNPRRSTGPIAHGCCASPLWAAFESLPAISERHWLWRSQLDSRW